MAKPKVEVKQDVYGPPECLNDFVSWLGGIVESVPENCRDSAYLELSVYEDYGGITREWTLRYWRDENEEETKKRLEANKRRREAARIAAKESEARKAAEERELYETLKRKFEQAGT